MNILGAIFAFLLFVTCQARGQNGYSDNPDTNTCDATVYDQCLTAGSSWNGGSACSAVYGGFRGNQNNLNLLMKNHLRDSFKFLIMGSNFNSDEVNRAGIPKLLQGYSDKMWEQGKSMLKYILKRGGKFSDSANSKMFYLDVPTGTETFSEVSALGASLDIMKQQAEDAIVVYKHANNRNNHNNGAHGDVNGNNANANGNSANNDKYFSGQHTNSYDPSISHFLEEKFIEEYTDNVRELAGYLNTLAKIVRNDNQRNMGLHLFDQSLA